MRSLLKLSPLLAAIAAFFIATAPASHAAFDVGDLVCETTTTTGTGTVNLGGAVTNYLTFVSQIASGNTVPYHIRASDGKLETGIGTFTDATPDTLSRTADWSSDGAGAELTLPAGTHNVCLGPISGSMVHNPVVEHIEMGADATYDIGTSTVGINDLHLGSGGVINFDGADITMTHAANALNIDGASVEVDTIELGAATDTTIARSAAGEATLEGDAVKHAGKQTIYIPGGAIIPNTTNGCAASTIETTTNDNMGQVCGYDTTTQEAGQWNIAMPKSWNEGTVTAQVYWGHGSTVTNFGVVFALSCVAVSNDDTTDVAFGTEQTVADTGGTTGDLYITDETPAVTCAGTPAEGDVTGFRLRRVPADGSDTLAVDATVSGVKLFYTDNASSDD